MNDHFRRHIVISSAVIITSLVVFGGGLYWLNNDLETQAERIINARNTVARRSSSLEALAELKQVAPRAEEYQRTMDRFLPTQDELIGFGSWLENLGRVRQVSVDFSFEGGQTASTENAPGFIPFSLRLSGGHQNVVGLVGDLELAGTQYLISLGGIELTRNGNVYKISTSGYVYFY